MQRYCSACDLSQCVQLVKCCPTEFGLAICLASNTHSKNKKLLVFIDFSELFYSDSILTATSFRGFLVINAINFTLKIKLHTTNSAFLVFVELSLDKPQHKTRLSNSRLSEQDKLELAHLCLATTWSLTSGRRGHTSLNVINLVSPSEQTCR